MAATSAAPTRVSNAWGRLSAIIVAAAVRPCMRAGVRRCRSVTNATTHQVTPNPTAAMPGSTSASEPDSSVTASIRIEALGPIYVSVIVDGAPAFDGNLATGEVTPFFNGSHIVVYTSDDSLTYYYSATTPGGFTMGGSGETTWDFP